MADGADITLCSFPWFGNSTTKFPPFPCSLLLSWVLVSADDCVARALLDAVLWLKELALKMVVEPVDLGRTKR